MLRAIEIECELLRLLLCTRSVLSQTSSGLSIVCCGFPVATEFSLALFNAPLINTARRDIPSLTYKNNYLALVGEGIIDISYIKRN